ncbi:MAG: glycoside hydrolase family 31 protein [Anaerolineales bacterium]|jgi:alpha-glucosidase
MKVTDWIRTLRFMGWETPYRAILFSLTRDRQDRGERVADRPDPLTWVSPGSIQSYAATAHGAEFKFENAQLEILFLSSDVVRVSWQPGEPPVPYAIEENFWPGADVTLSQDDQNFTLEAEQTSIQVGPNGKLSWVHHGISICQQEQPVRNGSVWKFKSALEEKSAVFGLGGRTHSLNLIGGSYRGWNRDPGGSYGQGDDPLYLNVPTALVIHESGSYLIFFENSYHAEFKIEDHLIAQFKAGMLRYYICLGDPSASLQRYSELTGKPELPPQWSLGFHQSRWGYQNEADIQEVLQGFQEHKLPLSAVHLDIDYMDGYRIFTVDPYKFPDLKSLSDQADNQGVKLVTIIDPGVKVDRGYRLYREGVQSDVFCTFKNERTARAPVWPGWVVFPDFTNPATRQWWQKQYPRLLNQGVAGIWHDMNEPATFTAWGDPTLPVTTEHTLEGKGGTHKQAHNLYGLLMNRAGFEALKTYQPEKRPFIISRSGWAGNQRFAWNWTGDVESSWEGLRVSLNLILGMGLSGIPYTGSDIGGFSGEPSPELMLRWMQLAMFTPFFRIHSALTSPSREPWRFDQPYFNALRQSLQLRYRMMPYLYTLAWKTSKTGNPIVRPFFWTDPSNPDYWDISDQFFLGSELLVAPILNEGVSQREILIPGGTWYSFWDDSVIEGPAWFSAEVSLETIPVFVRAGSVLPLEGDNLELHIYPGISLSREQELYSDSGEGYGPHRVDTFQLTALENAVEISWRQQGDYPFPYPQTEIHLHGPEARAIVIDGSDHTADTALRLAKPFQQIRFEL